MNSHFIACESIRCHTFRRYTASVRTATVYIARLYPRITVVIQLYRDRLADRIRRVIIHNRYCRTAGRGIAACIGYRKYYCVHSYVPVAETVRIDELGERTVIRTATIYLARRYRRIAALVKDDRDWLTNSCRSLVI